jgi:hypothetical protein
MKKMILPAAFLFLSASLAFATVTKDDVRKLLAAGISEDTIILFIHRNAPAVSPSPEDLAELKNAGASDKVLNALVEASKSTGSSYSSGSTTSPGTTTTTVVYPSTSYYYDYYPYYYPYYYSPYLYTYPFLSFSFGFGFSNVHCDDHHHQDFHHQDFHHDQVHTMPHPTASPHGGGASTFRGGGGHGGGGHGGGGHGGHR